MLLTSVRTTPPASVKTPPGNALDRRRRLAAFATATNSAAVSRLASAYPLRLLLYMGIGWGAGAVLGTQPPAPVNPVDMEAVDATPDVAEMETLTATEPPEPYGWDYLGSEPDLGWW